MQLDIQRIRDVGPRFKEFMEDLCLKVLLASDSFLDIFNDAN